MKSVIALVLSGLLLVACAETGKKAPTEGRITIGGQEDVVLTVSKSSPSFSEKQHLKEWASAHYNAQNNVPRSYFGAGDKQVYAVSIGEGIKSKQLSIPAPVVMGDNIYTLDSRFNLQATHLKTGEKIWHVLLADIQGTSFKSIGLALFEKNLYAVAGNGVVVALDLSGKEQWKIDLKTQLRSAPVIHKGNLFLSDINNQLFVLDTKTGKTVWTYQGERATTNLFGVGSVAVSDHYVVMPTTNGRVNVFDRTTGVLLWTEDMWQKRTYNPMMDIPHMTASPVIEKNSVYLVGNAGKMGAYHLDSGMSVYTLAMGGRETPVVNGNVLLLINNQNQVMALNKSNGQKFWMTDLTKTQEKHQAGWYAPILANDLVVVASELGEIVYLNAKTGIEQKRIQTDKIASSPIVAQDYLIVLTQDGELQLYQ